MIEAAHDSASPYLYEFYEADAGKTAHWLACSETTAGDKCAGIPIMPWTSTHPPRRAGGRRAGEVCAS